jgi:hypothetical protein
MNEALQLLAEVDIRVTPEYNLSVPKGLPAELIEKIKTLKPQLVELLSRPKPKPQPEPDPEPLPPAAVNNPPIKEPDSQLPEAPVSYQPAPEAPAIPEAVTQEIRRWEPQLRAMGWSQGQVWGLASILKVGDQIMFATFDSVSVNFRDGRGTLRVRANG